MSATGIETPAQDQRETWDLRSVPKAQLIGRLTVGTLGVGVAGGVLTAWVVAGLTVRLEWNGGLTDVLSVLPLAAIYGLVGLIPALVSLAVLILALLALRSSATPPGLTVARTLLAGVATVVTSGCGLLASGLTLETLAFFVPVGLAAGAGALLVSRWCLVDRRV